MRPGIISYSLWNMGLKIDLVAKYWQENKPSRQKDLSRKVLCADMFPYPSGAGYMLDIL